MLRKILVVEDSEMNRKLLRGILEREYEVIEVENGREAMDILHKRYKSISAVILDLVMPVMDGYEVLQAIRGNAVLSQLPVIVTTGSDSEDTEALVLSLGANDFITKPYNPSLMLHRLRNTINLRETASIVNAIQRDKLTGAYSREAFFDKVDCMIGEQKPGFYVMSCFDIDNFKLINDQYGAQEGDHILRHIGKTLQTEVSEMGGICSRISADNFALLYPEAGLEQDYTARIREMKLIPSDTRATFRLSVGCYRVTDLSLSASAIYDRAYMAKRSVKGRYDQHVAWFDDSMRDRLLREQAIINDMDTALSERQFETWLQPQFNHATGALIGAEALARWRHPERGLITPNDFIPLFEQNGFVYELDKYVLEQTCQYLRKWMDEGRSPLPLAVNISRYDVFHEDLIDVITALTDSYDIPTRLLRLEITESAFSQSSEQIISVVKRLMALGFTVEIDDFGSGYSSLNTLKDVPADVLKLDMRFLESSENSQRGGNILESVVRMAKWLNMSVIAEGVETAAQAEFLKSIGCNYVQGFLYAEPMPVEEYEALAADIGKEQRLLAMEAVENLDNNSFWDPQSMDTLVFNSFIGGACIFEYYNGKIELLRANNKYTQVLGSATMSIEDAQKLDWREHISPEDYGVVDSALSQSASTGDEVTVELRFTDIPGCPPVTYLRSALRVIASTGDRLLVYCVNDNMTAQRVAEMKEREASEQVHAIMEDAGSGLTATVPEGGETFFLLANSMYYETLGYTQEQYDSEVKNVYDLVHPDDREWVAERSLSAYRSGTPTRMEYRVIRRDGELRWVRSILSRTRFSGVKPLVQLSVFTDITAEKKAEQELRDSDEQLRFLNDTAHELLAQPDTAVALEKTLRKLLEYFDGDRVFVYEFDFAMQSASNSYEVCAPGVSAEKVELQHLPMEMMRFWLQGFEKQPYIEIRDLSSLGPEHTQDKAELQSQGISSLIAVPLKRDGAMFGFIGVDNPGRQNSHIGRLVALGDYIAVMLTRRDLDAKINSDSRVLAELMNDTPGGFVRMRTREDGSIVPIYFNTGFCKLTGMDHDELMELYGEDAMAGVYPEDLPIVRAAVVQMRSSGEARSAQYRLLNKKGEYFWVRFYGRAVTNDAGEMFFNIYYTDVSDQEGLDRERRELLDNLPCGAAIYEYSGGALKVKHLNRRYRVLVGTEDAELTDDAVISAVHPDDRQPLLAMIDRAIRSGSDISTVIRIRFGESIEYRRFRVSGRIVPKGGDAWSIYVALAPDFDDSPNYQQMLPVALAAVIGASPDMAFVKDTDLRFVCCSRPFVESLGLSDASELVGRTDYDLVPKKLADRYTARDMRIIREGKPLLNYEEIQPSADGSLRYSRTFKYPLFDHNGGVIGIYSIITDTTHSHQTENQLKLITDSIPGGLATYVATGDGVRRVYYNDGFARLFGYEQNEQELLVPDKPAEQADGKTDTTAQIIDMLRSRDTAEIIQHVRIRGGIEKWISCKAVAVRRDAEAMTVNAVLTDVTQLQESLEQLRISEELHRLAMAHSGNIICRYNVEDRTLALSEQQAEKLGVPQLVEDVPESLIRSGVISAESADDYRRFFESIRRGENESRVCFREHTPDGSTHWIEGRASTILSASGKPSFAVISFADVTEKLEMEAIYNKWQQSVQERDIASFSMFRCNLSASTAEPVGTGSLLYYHFSPEELDFNRRAREYASACVYEEDQGSYLALLNSDSLLAGYYRGKRRVALDYRERLPEGEPRWLRISIEMVAHPGTGDIEAFMLYENIDEDKRAELTTLRRAETDALTGVLNRATFINRAERLMRDSGSASRHALLMLDLDGFKLVNDVFGHSVGDQTLAGMAETLRGVLRRDDLVGRLGGDEFVVFLSNIPSDSIAAKRAQHICQLLRRVMSEEVRVSVSIGIVICPRDGTDFETLYKKADSALYYVKASGKDNYAFYNPEMSDRRLALGAAPGPAAADVDRARKRRMLIVDDSRIDFELLSRIFRDEFIIEKAMDGATALVRLRHYGSAISVVLLDLNMPEMDGFAVLEKMRASPELRLIPVIVVSVDGDRETSLKAIRRGASDYITKPVDVELLRIRVSSAISKAENERLRALNSFLELQNGELDKYRTVLSLTHTALIEHDWIKGSFHYDQNISDILAGRWDSRSLWKILMADMVADVKDVRRMQEFVRVLAEDRKKVFDCMTVRLRAVSGAYGHFRVSVYKQLNEYLLTNKLILTIREIGEGGGAEL